MIISALDFFFLRVSLFAHKILRQTNVTNESRLFIYFPAFCPKQREDKGGREITAYEDVKHTHTCSNYGRGAAKNLLTWRLCHQFIGNTFCCCCCMVPKPAIVPSLALCLRVSACVSEITWKTPEKQHKCEAVSTEGQVFFTKNLRMLNTLHNRVMRFSSATLYNHAATQIHSLHHFKWPVTSSVTGAGRGCTEIHS